MSGTTSHREYFDAFARWAEHRKAAEVIPDHDYPLLKHDVELCQAFLMEHGLPPEGAWARLLWRWKNRRTR